MVNSRAKGIRGELEVRDLLRRYGFAAKRGQQHAGGDDSPDVKHNMEGFHIEVKRVQKLALYPAMEQAAADAALGETPIVFHKRNHKDWVVVIDAEDFLDLMNKYVYTRE